MQVQRRGLSPAPFLVFVLLIALGLSFMFTYNGITESKADFEIVKDNFSEALITRYSIVEDLTDILIRVEINKILEARETEDEDDDEVELEDTQFHVVKYLAEELVFEPMAYGKDDKRLELEQTIEEFRNINRLERIEDQFLALQFRNLIEQLESIEEESFNDMREQYNETALKYNEKISSFPNNLVALLSRTKRAEIFPKLEGNN